MRPVFWSNYCENYEGLVAKYGVVESVPPFGPAVIVPNSEYKPGWTDVLNRASLKVYCGEESGRVAWIIPLKGWLRQHAGVRDPVPLSTSTRDLNDSAIQIQAPRRGCARANETIKNKRIKK